jgi:hypothetical protein
MKHSVWLRPAAEDAPGLQAWIERCSAAFGSPRFVPHITLCTEPALTSLANTGLQLELPLTLTVTSVGFGGDYFHACYLLLRDNAGVLGLQARSAAALHGRVPEQYPPHLSLAYGALRETQRREVGSLVTHLPLTATFDRIEVWETGGAVADWQPERATTEQV